MSPRASSHIWNNFTRETKDLAKCKSCGKKLLTRNLRGSTCSSLINLKKPKNILRKRSTNLLKLSPTSRLRNLLNKKLKTANNLSDFKKECSTYESLPICNSTTEILEWWKIHAECLPLLAKLGRKYLAIPASSTRSERVFRLQTTGGRVVTSSRTSLEPGKVEALVVINRNKGQLNK